MALQFGGQIPPKESPGRPNPPSIVSLPSTNKTQWSIGRAISLEPSFLQIFFPGRLFVAKPDRKRPVQVSQEHLEFPRGELFASSEDFV